MEAMQALKLKLIKLFLPYLGFSIALLAAYNLGRWVLDIQLGLVSLKTEILDFWLPWLLPWLCIPLWLKRRIRLLQGAGWQQDGYFAHYFVINISVAVVIFISQINMTSAPFSLISLQHVSDVMQHPRQQYFDIEIFNVPRSRCRNIQFTDSISSRGGTSYNFKNYYTCPLDQSGTLWYAVLFSKRYNPDVDDLPRQQEQQRFNTTTEQKFAQLDLQQVSYFERLRPSNDLTALLKVIPIPSATADPMVLRARHEPFSQRLGHDYSDTLYAFIIAAVVVFLMLLVAKVKPEALQAENKRKPRQVTK
ncbi:hypothetical protein [Alkalimonas mucilaginosa]|uniref:Uncharacterized protein n=1 Tax=Alkalimonas mucilaginosa TaxID=3057676 RepID=A0ABU7JEG3_9GAMM|nr:hypothetical protein [Alkalimonas sp. MEB004]MEE2023545.1 hypothetical protein [Alkalimonas sp. MEB004]